MRRATESGWRKIGIVLGSAALACACCTAVAWPSSTSADEPARAAVVAAGARTAPAPALRVHANLVQDPRDPARYLVEVTAENPSDRPEEAQVEELVLRTVSSPMARVMPAPTMVWKHRETLRVAARGRVTLRHEIPQALARQVADAAAPPSRHADARDARLAMAPRPSFRAEVRRA